MSGEFLVSINYVPAVGRLNVNQNIAADGSLPRRLTIKGQDRNRNKSQKKKGDPRDGQIEQSQMHLYSHTCAWKS